MSNEHIQKDLNVYGYTDTHLTSDDTAGVQALILGAYLDDKKRWEDKLMSTSEAMADKIKELTAAKTSIATQSKVVAYVYKLFKIKTKQEKRLIQIMKEVDELKNKILDITSSPPSPNAYELAIIGNNLFKAR